MLGVIWQNIRQFVGKFAEKVSLREMGGATRFRMKKGDP